MIFNRKQGLNTSRRGLCQNKNKSKRYVGFKNSNNIPKMLFSWDMLKTLNNLLVEISVNLFVLSSVCKQKECLHWSVHDLESLAGLSHDLAIWKKTVVFDGWKAVFVLLWLVSRTSVMEFQPALFARRNYWLGRYIQQVFTLVH